MKTISVLLFLMYVVASTRLLGADSGHKSGGQSGQTNIRIIASHDDKGKEGKKNKHQENEQNIPLDITVHLQDIGDVLGHEDAWVGTKGESRRLQGFSITLPSNLRDNINLEYFAHLQDIGDTAYVSSGTFVGTRGQSRRLEGFAIRVTGKDAKEYSVYYAAHLENIGDTDQFKNGDFCGTRGESRRVEAIKVRFVKNRD